MTTGIPAVNNYFFPPRYGHPIRTYQFNFPRRAACGRSPHFTVLKRLDLTSHYLARSLEGLAHHTPDRACSWIFKVRGNPGDNALSARSFFPCYLYPHLSYLTVATLSGNSSVAMRISCRYFLLVHVDIEVGDRWWAVILPCSSAFIPRVHPCVQHRYDTRLDEISKFHNSIDVRKRFGWKYHSKAELRKWTRRPVRWSSVALSAVRSRSVSVWSAFGPTRPTRSSVAPSGWSLWRWRRPFSIDISSYTFARTTCRIWWMASALRCLIASCYWNLRYFGLIDGEPAYLWRENERHRCNLSMRFWIEGVRLV